MALTHVFTYSQLTNAKTGEWQMAFSMSGSIRAGRDWNRALTIEKDRPQFIAHYTRVAQLFSMGQQNGHGHEIEDVDEPNSNHYA